MADHGRRSQARAQPVDDVDGLGAQLAQMIVPTLTAQNSCQVHEQCDSSCPNRIGVRRYLLMPNGERRHETDERASLGEQLGAARGNDDGQPPRQQPFTIHPDTPRFVYTKLSSPHGMIRLVKLRSAYFRKDPVDCELLTFAMDDLPPYREGPFVLLGCGSRCVQNDMQWALILCTAQLRTRLQEAASWIQFRPNRGGDLEEKGAQIQLMERIYSYASTVYVDLGDTDGRVVSGGFNLSATIQAASGMGSPEALIPVGRDTPHPLLYKTVFLALQQPWFTRTWVIQEAALARRAVYMFCGNVLSQRQLDDILSREAMRANPRRTQELMQLGSNDALRNYLNYAKLQQIKNARERIGSLELMELTRDFAATDPADKVFGLLALMSDEDRCFDVSQLFKSDGDSPSKCSTVQVSNEETTLNEGFHPESPTGWDRRSRRNRLLACVLLFRMVGDESGSGGLSLRGMIVDTIDSVVHVHSAPVTAEGEPSFLAFHGEFRPAFDSYVSGIKGKPRYMDNEEVFARSLLMDDTYTGRNAILHSSPIENPALTYRSAH
ncbi:HET domain protein [Metarhizium acridum CQMa 102]|uniref:HET domain protein n=1 Tax=Metarhizium acridum (strain CQMa 102) TaxID=655827 RepID=E9DV39_METAQ|nr:HET domain protein [Metarhizium acridum CQMa 102]EFY92463.1 HET domain protein [Metarhizium acridum CQMa 102]